MASGLPGDFRKIDERPSVAEVFPFRTAPGCPDDPPHLVAKLRLRVQHGRDRDGVIIGPDHDEPALVTAHGALRTQPVAEHRSQRYQGKDA